MQPSLEGCLAKIHGNEESIRSVNNTGQKKTTGLVSESVRFLLILSELILPQFDAAVGFMESHDKLSITFP